MFFHTHYNFYPGSDGLKAGFYRLLTSKQHLTLIVFSGFVAIFGIFKGIYFPIWSDKLFSTYTYRSEFMHSNFNVVNILN